MVKFLLNRNQMTYLKLAEHCYAQMMMFNPNGGMCNLFEEDMYTYLFLAAESGEI